MNNMQTNQPTPIDLTNGKSNFSDMQVLTEQILNGNNFLPNAIDI